jgi:hypothetical protein
MRSEVGGEALSRPKFFVSMMFLAFLVRLAIMIPFNFGYWALILPTMDIGTIIYIITIVLSINTIQSIGDALIPYLVIYPTGIFKHFKMW